MKPTGHNSRLPHYKNTQQPKAIFIGQAFTADEPRGPPWSIIPTERRVESFADD